MLLGCSPAEAEDVEQHPDELTPLPSDSMDLDLHVSRFDWAGGDDRIGAGVRDLAQRAEAIGVRTMFRHVPTS